MTQQRRFGEDNSPFATWIRGNKELDSVRHSVVCTDVDRLFLRYRTKEWSRGQRLRSLQHMMVVEEKTWGGGKFNVAQNDALGFLHQLGIRRREQKSAKGIIKVGSLNLLSLANKSFVEVKWYGVFYLVFSNTSPADSSWMKWGCVMKGVPTRVIDETTLVQLLRFDIHPMNFNPIDERSHHAERLMPLLESKATP